MSSRAPCSCSPRRDRARLTPDGLPTGSRLPGQALSLVLQTEAHHALGALARVAERSGFGSLDGLHRAFQKQLGVTPGEYRQRFGRQAVSAGRPPAAAPRSPSA